MNELDNQFFYKVFNCNDLFFHICKYLNSIYDLVKIITLNKQTIDLKKTFKKCLTEYIMKPNLSTLLKEMLYISFDDFTNCLLKKYGLVLSGSTILWSICGPYWAHNNKLYNSNDGFTNFESHHDDLKRYPNDFDLYINTSIIPDYNENIDFIKEMKKLGFILVTNNFIEVNKFLVKLLKSMTYIEESQFIKTITTPIIFDTFINEFKSLQLYNTNDLVDIIDGLDISKKKINKCYNFIFKYRILIIHILTYLCCDFDYKIFGIFRFIKKKQLTLNKFYCANIQIMLNDNYLIKFENYDFQFLKSYLIMGHNNNYEFQFNNSLKSIIMINSNNKKEPYIDTSAYYSPNNSHICLNNKCNIKYTIEEFDFDNYRTNAITIMKNAIIRQLKYSARGFNCLNTYFQTNNNEIWFIYDFYLNTIPESRILCGEKILLKLISQCTETQIAIKNCFFMEKYDITYFKDDGKEKENK